MFSKLVRGMFVNLIFNTSDSLLLLWMFRQEIFYSIWKCKRAWFSQPTIHLKGKHFNQARIEPLCPFDNQTAKPSIIPLVKSLHYGMTRIHTWVIIIKFFKISEKISIGSHCIWFGINTKWFQLAKFFPIGLKFRGFAKCAKWLPNG